MSRYIGPKRRLSRRCGVHLFGSQKIGRKRKVPGAHGKTAQSGKELSLFGDLLNEKRIFANGNGCLRFKYLCNVMKDARTSKWLKVFGNAVGAFGSLVEMRLDIFVYRAGMAPTIMAAQQLVSHKHIEVDGKIVNIRSFRVRPGMKVKIASKDIDRGFIKKFRDMHDGTLPVYIEADADGTFFFRDEPKIENINYGFEFNISKVCEYLSLFV